MPYTPKELTQADMLGKYLVSQITDFNELAKGLAGEGLSIRVTVLAITRLLACSLPTVSDAEDVHRRLGRLLAQQLVSCNDYDMSETNEDQEAAKAAFAEDDCGITSELLNEMSEPCDDCGEYHWADPDFPCPSASTMAS